MRWDGQYSDRLLEIIDWCLNLNHLYRPQRLRPAKALVETITPPARKPRRIGWAVSSKNSGTDPMRFTIYQESRRRPRQQRRPDDLRYSRDALLMVVADGMGGHHYGEIAAQIAVQTLADAFQREPGRCRRRPFRFLQKSMTNAHHAISTTPPATTCATRRAPPASPAWSGQRRLLAHAGDSACT